MATVLTWWGQLSGVNQAFYAAAIFFSVFFVWQLISALLGLAGDHGIAAHDLAGGHDFDAHAESTLHHEAPHDAHDTVLAFRLVSLRSVLAFLTLFAWATALYMNSGLPLHRSLSFAALWGLAAMILVSLLVHWLSKLGETGNIRVETCIGATGTVYLDIPEKGPGEIRVMCSGVLTHLKAVSVSGPLKAGAAVRVIRITGPNTVEVQQSQSANA